MSKEPSKKKTGKVYLQRKVPALNLGPSARFAFTGFGFRARVELTTGLIVWGATRCFLRRVRI